MIGDLLTNLQIREKVRSKDFYLRTLLFGVMLCGFFRVVIGVQVVTVRDVGMMASFFMVPACVMLGRFFVMSGRVFIMLRSFSMMFCAFFTHRVTIEGLMGT